MKRWLAHTLLRLRWWIACRGWPWAYGHDGFYPLPPRRALWVLFMARRLDRAIDGNGK